jgi:cobalt/nickel transport system permease protein
LAVLLGAVLLAAVLAAVGKEFERLAQAVLLAHIPVAVVEGLVTSSAVLFLRKVRPELLEAPWVPAAWEASDA